MKSTDYFRSSVLPRRPYLRNHWIERVLHEPLRTQVQANGRIRYWALIPEVGRYLRVVTEADGQTVHDAFRAVASSRDIGAVRVWSSSITLIPTCST